MELTSFCIGSKIMTEKPCVDDCDASNLISQSNHGFVCESFIRPPIDLTIKFPFPVDIAYIVLETQVGSRKSTGFKIFSKRLKDEENSQLRRTSISSNEQIYVEKNGDFSNRNCEDMDSELFLLGNWFSIKEEVLLLKNHHYRHFLDLDLRPENELTRGETYVGALRNGNKLAMKSVKGLVITITRVVPTGPPVLKKIQVWGQPASLLPFLYRNKIVNAYKNLLSRNSPNEIKNELSSDITVLDKELNSKITHDEDSVVPEDFLDPLTCNIMVLPVLLPSGNSVDSSTLDKFIASEAMWNRPPSDPFTGVPFKGVHKPEPNVTLKARIDKFLLVEKNLPRSVMNQRGYTVSGITNEESYNRKRKLSGSHHVKVVNPDNSSSVFAPKYSSQFKNLAPNLRNDSKAFVSSSTILNSSEKGYNISVSTPSTSKTSFNITGLPTSKGSLLRRGSHSLVHSLGAILSSTSKVVPKSVKTADNSINASNKISSNQVDNSDQYSLTGITLNPLECSCGTKQGVFYTLNCSHVICSNCVKGITVNASIISCIHCHNETEKRDLIRAHPKSAFTSS